LLQMVIMCGLIIAGLISLVIDSNLSSTSPIKPYLNEISSLLLISGVLTLLDRFFTQKQQDKKMRELFRIHDSVELMGIKEIFSESQAYNFTDMLDKEDQLNIILNDGFRWVGNNSVALSNRFNNNFETIIFTLDPGNLFIPAQAEKTDVTVASLQSKINETWNLLQKLYNESNKTGKLTIYAVKHFPMVGLFISNTKAVFTLYQTSSGRTNVPLFEIEKNHNPKSLYSFFKNDVNKLKDEARIIFKSH
jgi:hypothetical protein